MYREVPQASTGFSPFELLYGRAVRGPLDILRETWKVSEKSSESVISHVLNMREKLEKMLELAQENLAAVQVKQKSWYDRMARVREFQPGDKLLVQLPTSTQKLYAQWQEPYQIVKRKGQVDYVVDMHDRRKKHWLFHVNMLKQFVSSPACMYVSEVRRMERWTTICRCGRKIPQSRHDPRLGNNSAHDRKQKLLNCWRSSQMFFERGLGRQTPALLTPYDSLHIDYLVPTAKQFTKS